MKSNNRILSNTETLNNFIQSYTSDGQTITVLKGKLLNNSTPDKLVTHLRNISDKLEHLLYRTGNQEFFVLAVMPNNKDILKKVAKINSKLFDISSVNTCTTSGESWEAIDNCIPMGRIFTSR